MAEHRQRVRRPPTLPPWRPQGAGLRSADGERAEVAAAAPEQTTVPGLAGGGGAGARRSRRCWCCWGSGIGGAVRHTPVTVQLHLPPIPAPGRRWTPVVLTAAAAAVAGGLTGLLGADEEEVRRHHGLPAGDLSGLTASLDRPIPVDDRRTLNYSYRGGWDDPTTSPKSPDATPVDLSKFDAKAVVGAARGAGDS